MTANGRPYGIATTIIEIPRIKYLRISRIKFVLHPSGMRSLMINLMVKARKTKIAVATPNLPILETNLSSLSSNGVS